MFVDVTRNERNNLNQLLTETLLLKKIHKVFLNSRPFYTNMTGF